MSIGKQKQKSKKPLIITTVAVFVVAAAVGCFYFSRQAKTASANDTSSIKTMMLRKTDLLDLISVSGTIYSGNSQNVYTTHSYPIKEVYVEVGDVVKAGDVLAVLDMTDLDYDIKQAEYSLENSMKSASESKQNAVNNVTNAQLSVETSTLNLEKAQLNYDLLKEKVETGKSNELINAENSIDTTKQAVQSAQKDMETKTNDYETNKQLFGVGGISQSDLDTSERLKDDAVTAYETAVSNYEKALDTYNRTKASLEEDLITAEKDLEATKLNYQNALNSLSQAKSKSTTTTSTVETQQISLSRLRENRQEAEIVAPIDGTITQVNATIGMTGAGSSGSGSSGSALFVIEDMNDLYVSSSIKEFRIGDVSIGQEAYVTTDATSDRSFKGELSFIAPTATETSSTSNVEFEIKIQLKETEPNLRIGMNAYANIVLESKEDVYAADYDAIFTSRTGESFVYASENNTVVEIPVEIGLETDTSVEISGAGLKDGMIIFANASSVAVGETIELPAGGGFGGMQGGRTMQNGSSAIRQGQGDNSGGRPQLSDEEMKNLREQRGTGQEGTRQRVQISGGPGGAPPSN